MPGTSDLSPAMKKACVFCRRVEDLDFIGYGRDVVAFEPLNPVTPGHMLFLPRRHVRAAESIPWITAQVMEIVCGYAGAEGDDYNLITSSGDAATQTIHHLHIHYVPRRPDDGLHLPWTGQNRHLLTPGNSHS